MDRSMVATMIALALLIVLLGLAGILHKVVTTTTKMSPNSISVEERKGN
jgi:hypothetical protein